MVNLRRVFDDLLVVVAPEPLIPMVATMPRSATGVTLLGCLGRTYPMTKTNSSVVLRATKQLESKQLESKSTQEDQAQRRRPIRVVIASERWIMAEGMRHALSVIPSFFRGPKCNWRSALRCGGSRLTSPEARVRGSELSRKRLRHAQCGTLGPSVRPL